jgi:hypothetical protein
MFSNKMTQDIILLYWNEIAIEANRISHTTGDDGKIGNQP